jgi:hypothetical protein
MVEYATNSKSTPAWKIIFAITSCTASDSSYSSLNPLTDADSCGRFHGGVKIFRFAANDIGDRGDSWP